MKNCAVSSTLEHSLNNFYSVVSQSNFLLEIPVDDYLLKLFIFIYLYSENSGYH